MVAAVADWRSADESDRKIKKDGSGQVPPLRLVENPDILATLCKSPQRPALVVGFAAETNDVLAHAQAKLARKGADWIVANDVARHAMGGEVNALHIVTADRVTSLPEMTKDVAAAALIERIADALA
jgi:phosphopantothenoylcysteine decarboxylase/phosphopantothenate--cysteine ligase